MLHEKELENDIRKLADIIEEKKLTSAFVKCGDYEIKLERRPAHPGFPPAVLPPFETAKGEGALSHSTAKNTPEGNAVRSPIVGTFYEAPSPGKPPFVKVGDKVKKGEVIFIIESMKLMNEVLSDFDGTVGEILVKNGDPLEFDQIVMTIL
jgi:acetyl-CoA carboxylase biotin carboxyl carrier protein